MKGNTFTCRDVSSPQSIVEHKQSLEEELRFFQEIKNAKLLIPCSGKNEEAIKGYSIAVLSTQNGEIFLPAFTNQEEFDKWPYENCGTIVCSYDDIKHKVIDNPQKLSGIVINPFGKMRLLRLDLIKQVDAKTEGMSVERIEHGKNLRLFRPKQEFLGLAEKMKTFLKTHEEVYKVYLLLAQEPNDRKPHWFIIVDFDGERAALFPAIAHLVQPYMKPGDTFELIKATDGLLQKAALRYRPIYTKLGVIK